jgi:hypothetical protein
MTSINRAFLTITCAAATMTAILLVSSGDALARKAARDFSAVPPPVECGVLRKASRKPDQGGEVVERKSTPVVKRKITPSGTAHIRHPQRRF